MVPVVRVTSVLPTLRLVNMLGAFTSYQSFLEKGSTAFFLPPFLPLLMRLFFPTCRQAETELSRWCQTEQESLLLAEALDFRSDAGISLAKLLPSK